LAIAAYHFIRLESPLIGFQWELDFLKGFYLDYGVSAVDHSKSSHRGKSVSQPDSDLVEQPTKESIAGQKWPMSFTTTHWSVVLEAQTESPTAQEALEKLCHIYWPPIYSFVRKNGVDPEEAKDVTQKFFADLLEHRSLTAVRKEKGRFRSYLLGALKYFLADEQRRVMAIKRGKGQRLIPLEELTAGERSEMEPADSITAEQIYERQWACTLLERVLGLLKNEYIAAGNAALFDCLKQLLPDEPGSPSQADIAGQLGMTANAVRQAFHRFRQRYQLLLREEIAHTVATPGDVEDELRHLIAVVRA
jgi:DNA-directed RNA polymerase specialized sigma24 family protein